MTTTREKAAREVYGLAPAHHDLFHPLYRGRARTWEEAPPIERARCFAHVDAVLRAIRTPSRKLLREIAGAMSPGKRPTQARVSENAKHGIRWRAGIDSIINGEG